MKWSLNINQPQAIELGLKNAQEAIILGMICDSPTWAEPVVIDGDVYYWTARHMIADELPLLNLKPDSVYRALRALVSLGLIEYRKSGAKDCTRLTPMGKSYYVGKKSEQALNSEKNPSEFGKKSEKHSENFPTYTSTISYPSTNHHHREEEEGVLFTELVSSNPYSLLPDERIGGLDRATIAEGIERLVVAHAGDEQRYRETLIREILSGGGRTIANIHRLLSPQTINPSRPRIGSNRGEPLLPPEINIFDVIESLYGGGEKNVF